MSDEIKKCPAFCKDGNFRSYGDYDSSNSTLLKYAEEMYRELEVQYKYFIKITNGKANNMHIDFHLWDNQRLPIAAALGRFLRTYKIERCRLVGAHQHYHGIRANLRYLVMRVLSFSPFTKTHSSTRINYYIHRKNEFKSSLIDFYVYPDVIDGQVYDNSVPIFGANKYLLEEHIRLSNIYDYKVSNWEDYKA